jgi:hypothetical protein
MTGWNPQDNRDGFAPWKPEPAKEEAPTVMPQTPPAYWPFPKVDLDVGGVLD